MKIEHARGELSRLPQDARGREVHEKVVEALEIFNDIDNTTELMAAQNIFIRLLVGKNLSPLTDDPDEWWEIGEGGFWQSKRNAFAFSTDGGKTFYELDVRNPADRSKYLIQETRSHK